MEDSKHIEGFEDYLIFSSGKVYSFYTNKYLKPSITPGVYYWVWLCNSGEHYHKLISRLIAQAFIPNPENKPEINHKDGDKANNNVSNLEWVTASENQFHAYATGLKTKSPNAGKKPVPINLYDYKTGEFKSTQPSIHEAARAYGLHQGSISNVLAGIRNHAGGYTFKRV